MSVFSDKKRFVKTFCAFSVIMLMLFSSLVSVAATMSIAAGFDELKSTHNPSAVTAAPKNVVLDINGSQRVVQFAGETVEELLRANRVEFKNKVVNPDCSATVTPYMVVTVRDAKPVTLTADGRTRTVILTYGRVAESLRMAGIALSDEDILSVSRDTPVEKIDTLSIRRVTVRQITQTAQIPFEKVTKSSADLPSGETKVIVKGKNGEKQIIKSVKYIDGEKTEEKTVSEKIVKAPVSEVTLEGTKSAA